MIFRKLLSVLQNKVLVSNWHAAARECRSRGQHPETDDSSGMAFWPGPPHSVAPGAVEHSDGRVSLALWLFPRHFGLGTYIIKISQRLNISRLGYKIFFKINQQEKNLQMNSEDGAVTMLPININIKAQWCSR